MFVHISEMDPSKNTVIVINLERRSQLGIPFLELSACTRLKFIIIISLAFYLVNETKILSRIKSSIKNSRIKFWRELPDRRIINRELYYTYLLKCISSASIFQKFTFLLKFTYSNGFVGKFESGVTASKKKWRGQSEIGLRCNLVSRRPHEI